MSWIVKLVHPPVITVYKEGFFPRRFAYKRDAVELAKSVNAKGGTAVVEKESK